MASRAQAACIVAAGGSGSRFAASRREHEGFLPKQFLSLGGVSVLRRSILAAAAAPEVEAIVVVAPTGYLERAKADAAGVGKLRAVVAGGATRVESVANALQALGLPEPEVTVVHDAARPLAPPGLFSATARMAAEHGAAIAAVRVDDTVKRTGPGGEVLETLSREGLWRVQTPQAFRTSLLKRAHQQEGILDATDDAALVERLGGRVRVVEGDPGNLKVTTAADLTLAERLLGASGARVGLGRDKHPLLPGRPFRMGGVEVPCEVGPSGHSDGDALCHAIADALLGAAVLGDIGNVFPDDRDETAGISGPAVLAGVRERLAAAGWRPLSLDATVWTARPRLSPQVGAMRTAIAEALRIPAEAVSVKAKSGNGIDAVGRGEAVEAEAVVSIAR